MKASSTPVDLLPDQGEQAAAESPKRFSTLLMLTWVFTVMSFVGLLFETIQHYLAFDGEWESRAGFIWGPFSPIYGLAAMLLTVFALKFDEEERRSNIFIFCVAALVGGVVEYFASWAMETFWGIVAWSYLEIPGNFNGRTDIFHMIAWGALGLVWVRAGWPFVKKVFGKIDTKAFAYRAITWALFIFIICDACMTIAVMLRADARTHGVEAATPIEQILDTYYPNEVLQARFENMGGIGRPD